MNILAIRPGAIGDALLAFPTLHALRSKYAAKRIVFVSNASVLPVAQAWKVADEVADFEQTRWSELFSTTGIRNAELRELLAATDMAICWLGDPDHRVETNLRQAGVKKIIVAPGRPPENSFAHVAEYLASTVKISAKEVRQWHPTLPGAPNAGRTVAIHPGSGSERKNWPIASYAEIIKSLWQEKCEVLLLAGPAEEQKLAYLQRHLKPPVGLDRTLVSAPLLEITQQLQQCRGYLGNDSGITHLAAMLGVPTVAIFGPTSRTSNWEPLGRHVSIIQQPDLNFLTPYTVMAIIRADFRLMNINDQNR
ncbi:MAG TPA: glycosyltransferase family 9 protein [Ktedonobacteraceae bacterium]